MSIIPANERLSVMQPLPPEHDARKGPTLPTYGFDATRTPDHTLKLWPMVRCTNLSHPPHQAPAQDALSDLTA